MAERGILEQDIEYALDHSDITMPGRRKGRKRIFSKVGICYLNLVIKETANRIQIITAAWRNRG